MLNECIEEVDIEIKSDREHVRLRRGMYLPNINYCFYEVIDNSVDERMAGYCNNIWIEVLNDRTTRVRDDGRGISVNNNKVGIPNIIAALGMLKAGGKFNQKNQTAKSGGLHGVGASAVNFTCDSFIATVVHDKIAHQIAWKKGEISKELHCLGNIENKDIDRGTIIEFVPDKEIWVDEDYDINALVNRIEQLSYLNTGLNFHLDIDYNYRKIKRTIASEKGLIEYIEVLSKDRESLLEPINITSKIEHEKLGIIEVNIALSYNQGYKEDIFVFTNNIPNAQGGHHLQGLKDGLFKSINSYYENTATGKTVSLNSSDVREGLVAIVSLKISDPVFDGQGKAALAMPAIRPIVRDLVVSMMDDYLDKHPNKAKLIIAKALQAQLTRESVRKARETTRSVKNLFGGTPNKLVDCKSKKPEECEIYFVEGDSAGGSAKKARDKNTQAVLPVFGKINNTEGMTILQVIKSVKLKDIVSAIQTGIGEDFDIEKLRYHKIIIMADADDDGLHIKTLYATLFYRHMRPLIENGHVYFACPPLYKVTKNKSTYKYCFDEVEKDEAILELGENCKVERFKGLGQMEAEELEESTMSPKSRRLIQLSISDIPEYDESIVFACMGDDVSLRKKLILNNNEMENNLNDFI